MDTSIDQQTKLAYEKQAAEDAALISELQEKITSLENDRISSEDSERSQESGNLLPLKSIDEKLQRTLELSIETNKDVVEIRNTTTKNDGKTLAIPQMNTSD